MSRLEVPVVDAAAIVEGEAWASTVTDGRHYHPIVPLEVGDGHCLLARMVVVVVVLFLVDVCNLNIPHDNSTKTVWGARHSHHSLAPSARNLMSCTTQSSETETPELLTRLARCCF